MTQSQFMYDLMVELDGVPDEDKFVLMNDYNQYFTDRIDEGLSEDDIISKLRSPKEIADGYRNGVPIPIDGVDSVLSSSQRGEKTPLSVLKFVLLIPVCALYEVLAVSVGVILLAAVAALCAAGSLVSVAAFMSASLNTGFMLLGIGGIFLTFAFIMLCAAVFGGALGAVKKFPGFMGNVLHNRTKERN